MYSAWNIETVGMNSKENKAVFLDRDGVIIMEKNFSEDTESIEILSGAIKGLKSIKSDFLKIVVTNQSGVARGYFDAETVEIFNNALSSILELEGIVIDAWYYCPHGPADNCLCRKPNPGMILKAAEDLNINLKNSWIIGDKSSDIMAGLTAGVKTILVKTGYAGNEPGAVRINPDNIADNLLTAVEYINRSLN